MRINTNITVVLLLALFVSGCRKLDLAPTDRFTELTFWESAENVNSALNNVYMGMARSTPLFYNEALSDNAFTKLGINSGQPDAIASGSFTTSLPRFQNDWAWYYAGIKSCNLFLENVDRNQTLAADLRERMKGEVRFIRAWHHFNLANWWGDVPLLSRDITADEAKTIARTPQAEVLAFVEEELEAVAELLPPRQQYAAADNGRITRGAAKAMLARVLLYQGGRMQEVAALCEQLMQEQDANGDYALAERYDELFSHPQVNKQNKESILSVQYVPTLRTWGEYIDFAPISAGARSNNLSPTQELVDSYVMENGKAITAAGSGYDEEDPYAHRDPRLAATIVYHGYEWTNPNGSTQTIYIEPGTAPAGQGANEYSAAGQGTATGYYWRKYWDPNASAPGMSSGLNLHLIRYADVLLMYAEAKEAQGQLTEAVWNQTIRVLRERAGFTDAAALQYPGTEGLREVVRNERRSELAMEGLRIDDIRRWRLAETVMNGWAHGARYGDPSTDEGYLRVQLRAFDPAKHYLWPIPPSERALNPNLTQNNGY